MARHYPEPTVHPIGILPAHHDVHHQGAGPELGLRDDRAGEKSLRLERGKQSALLTTLDRTKKNAMKRHDFNWFKRLTFLNGTFKV